MKKILDYKIVYAQNFQALEEDVRKEIKNGWQPHGGAFLDENLGASYSWNQTMVKYEA